MYSLACGCQIKQPRHEDDSRRLLHLLSSDFGPSRADALRFLQINTDLLDLQKDMTFSMALASTLNPEADKSNAAAGGWRQDIEGGLADDWEYIMHGKVSPLTKRG